MSVLSLSVVRATGEVVYAAEQEDEVTLAWRGEYLPGDKLVVRCDTHPVRLVLRLDASLAESHVLMTEDSFEFPIPLGCRQKAYGKRAIGILHTFDGKTLAKPLLGATFRSTRATART